MSKKDKVLILKGSDLMVTVTKNIIINLHERGLLPSDEAFGKKVVDAIMDGFSQYIDSQETKKETMQ